MKAAARKRDWPEGMRLALVVGVSLYRASSGRRELPEIPRDARNVADALRALGEFDVKTLENPDGDTLRRQIRDWLGAAPAGSHLVLYFAGHGISPGEAGGIRLLGIDGEGLEGSALAGAMASSRATNLLAVLDCCHSGAAALEATTFVPAGLGQDRTVHVVAASRADQPAKGSVQGGQLTRALLRAFEIGRTNAAGHVTLESAEAEIREWFRGRGGQSPSFNGPINTDFPLVWREPAGAAAADKADPVAEWAARGGLLPPYWRITWSEEKEAPPEGALWLYHDALEPDSRKKHNDCTASAFWEKRLAALGVDWQLPIGAREIRLRLGAVLEEIWTLWMLAWCESGRALPPEWADMCDHCRDVRGGHATDKAVAPEHRVRVIHQIIARTHRASGEAFLDDALKLCRHVGEQLSAGRKIERDDLVVGVPALARYVTQAEQDRPRYLEDKRSALRFTARLPGDRRPRLLVLDRPESAAFNIWSRCDPEATDEATGEIGYRLLLTRWKGADGKIVLSTDPERPCDIDLLLPGLSALESARRGGAGFDWVFPKGDHTQLAPGTVGADWSTALSLNEIVAFLEKELALEAFRPERPGAAPPSAGPKPSRKWPALAIAAIFLTLVAGGIWYGRSEGEKADVIEQFPALEIGHPLPKGEVQDLLRSPQGPRAFERYAVIAGVCSYPGDRALHCTCHDAEEVRKLLVTHYGYKPENIAFLVDRDPDSPRAPTAENMRAAIRKLGQGNDLESTKDDAPEHSSFLFYYSGHGMYEKGAHSDSSWGKLLTAGYYRANGTPDESKAWVMDEVLRYIKHDVASRHIMLLLDCCFSGWVAGAKGEEIQPADVRDLWDKPVQVAITASTSERAWEDQPGQQQAWGGHSVFTKYLLEGLTPSADGRVPADNGDGVITDAEIANYVIARVPRAVFEAAKAAGVNMRQTPLRVPFSTGSLEQGQFLFVPPAKMPEQ